MTVAAVILSATAEWRARRRRSGMPRVRRLADVAWSGGAVPIVVVAPDPDGAVAAALAGSRGASTARPPRPKPGPAGQMVRGVEVALAEVQRHDRGAASGRRG